MHVLVADRYQLDEPLGRGAMGAVWRATDQILHRPVAVKLLHTDQPEQVAATDAERFRLEARTAARLNHPHVVAVYDFGSHDGRPYLVMELVDGWTLAQERSRRGTLPPQEAAGIAAQMAAGLAAAHRQGVIHRDIKPANVMLTADRTVKITDFGIACFTDEAASTLTAAGKIVGSAAYLAPERALGRPAQPASDMYSLGCVLYELLIGRPPFTGATSLAVVQQHVEAAPVPPTRLRPDIPGPLAEQVLRLLAKDPAQRPTADQTAAWLSNTAQPAGPPAPQQMSPADSPPLPSPSPSAHLPRTAGLPAAIRRRAVRRPGMSPKALFALAGIVVFAVSAAVGVALTTDGGSSPNPASTPPPASSPATEKSTAAPLPSMSSAPVADDDNDDEDAEEEAEEERKAAEKEQKRQEEERKKQEEERKKAAEEARDDD